MSNLIGLCTWTFGNITLEEKLKISKELNVDGVELEGDLTISPRLIKELLKQQDLLALSVTPNNINLLDSDEKMRAKNVNYYLKLIDWSEEIGVPRIALHGDVGLVSSDDYDRDYSYLLTATRTIVAYAESKNIKVAFEVLNRYESFQINNVFEALKLTEEVDSSYLGILLDAYHMNIEEADPTKSLQLANDKLDVYHIADSNRLGAGSGNSDLSSQIEMLKEIKFTGPIIMEMTAPGPNPFTPVKGGDYINVLKEEYTKTIKFIKEKL